MGVFGSPGRTLVSTVIFMLAVIAAATAAYHHAGWSFPDSFYMVLLTVYTVGYGEVHPIDTAYLHAITVMTMILGCTGSIVLTGALVQFLTINQLQQLFGTRRMIKEIEHLSNHVIIVGYGRIGVMLARELNMAGLPFVIIERNERLADNVRELGFLAIVGDATDETSLTTAGVDRARALATVLPNDAANVFITLSARALNPKIEIIARGEMATTENKLIQAGADRVVMPTHIGAERIAELILYPRTEKILHASSEMQTLERQLRGLGLELQVVVAPERGALTGLTVAQIEKRTEGQFFIVQIHRQDGTVYSEPEPELKIVAGDGVVIVGRGIQSCRALFEPLSGAAGHRHGTIYRGQRRF
ncbi:potassium channel family protein [Martelella sp. HB161492]|uniref:potassium channel family protein n=1 Tax=Martelella sp. HB161492 TaxID=2720726 RepID=UPI00158FF606|nr:potassium channel family protein [Martelella sp. HB161492]